MLAKLERTVVDARNAVRDAVSGERKKQLSREDLVHQWRGLDLDEQNRRNLARLDELVIPWKKLRKAPTPLGARGSRPLVFMHIPKSGGTTLEYLIAKNYTINGVIHINAPALERNPAALFKKGEFPHVVMGHHKLNQPLYQFVDRPFVHITMLREPIGRILSYYDYLQTSPRHGKHEAAREMSLEEFVDCRDMVEVHNAQTNRLAGLLKRRVIRKRHDAPEALESARETLERRFSFFGITERYTEFLLTARRVLGWNDIFYQRKNVSKRKTKKAEVPQHIIDIIRERNNLDIELFEFATRLFDERCAELGIDESTVAAFNEQNRRYVELINAEL